MNVTLFQDAHLHRIGAYIQPEEINLRVTNALRFVIENIFANISDEFLLTLSTRGGAVEFWLNDIMAKLFATWGFMALQLLILNNKIEHLNVPVKHYCNMIMIDSLASLERTNIAASSRNADSLEYYFIFLQMRDHLLKYEMKKIFRYCFDNYWIHCNVMVQTAQGEVLIYTYFPFKDKQCHQTEPEMINKFIGNNFVNEIMFPDKLRNLNKCSLKLTTWNIPPFVINATDYYDSERNISGFEIVILLEISQQMNFTLDIDMISINTYNRNQTPEHEPISQLINQETNITMGYFRRTAARDKVATPSYVTYYLPFIAVTLRKKTHFGSMKILTFPFDTPTWALMLLLYVFIALINVFNIKNRIVENFQIHQVILGVPIKNVPQMSWKRIRFLTMLLSTFILRSVYQSLLFHLFRTHFYESPPLTMEGLIENRYNAVCSELSVRFLLDVPQIKDKSLPLIVIYNANEMYPLYYLELNKDKKFVAITNFEFTMLYTLAILSIENALQLLPINVNEQQIAFYFVKHSYLVDRFNDYILTFQQAGLLLKWKEWYNLEYFVTTTKSVTSIDNVLLINLEHLFGFFTVMLVLHALAAILFALEVLSKRFKWLQKFF